MKKIILLLLLITVFASCHDDKSNEETEIKKVQTVIMYLPWTDDNMINAFHNNIKGLEQAIVNMKGTQGRRVFVFMSENKQEASLTEITYKNKKCVHDTLKRYLFSGNEYATPNGIAGIICDIKEFAKTPHYAMIIGCHGMAWIPKGTKIEHFAPFVKPRYGMVVDEWKQTRFFGHSSDKEYQTDIAELSRAIDMADVHLDYILFDDCYMANIETAYELRRNTDFIIASPTEIMLYGMPYDMMGKAVMTMDWKVACNEFFTFYNGYKYPCGTISAICCEELENMAAVMKDINTTHSFDERLLDKIQIYDGLSKHIFFDMEHYVRYLCKGDQMLYSRFTQSLARLVPAKAATKTFYSVYNNAETPITTYSGISISDPSTNKAAESKTVTEWWRATHN
ncbi:clostripain-related cysteine peptidase [Prevotella sp. OH937_COT-195]|uniref:clostripain-related cysteine peptidase n=1 Tax=Prevotella sp. OH937_COT-195 TaxID=2491051 RepID=UPI0013156DBD|nr:clostripain-related cysteine peptidase [Prevotella sp. OH937_COT-195]